MFKHVLVQNSFAFILYKFLFYIKMICFFKQKIVLAAITMLQNMLNLRSEKNLMYIIRIDMLIFYIKNMEIYILYL